MAGTSFNLCNLPPWAIASRHFCEHPQPLTIQGVREANGSLFDLLDHIDSPDERAVRFDAYVSVKFQLHHWQAQATASARRSLRNGYVRFLRGWGFDSSSIEGAVLKGWVESRFGLSPTFHREPIRGVESEAYFRYVVDRMNGSSRTGGIHDQLDLLYTFAQYELARRAPGERWVKLWRGIHDAERAWEFGTTVWEARVPVPRVVLFGGLLPAHILRGEREWLVIGGELPVRLLR